MKPDTLCQEDVNLEIKRVSRWEPSSKTCSCCGWVNETLTLSDRIFVCMDCGSVQDRDYNAARNLAALA
ncbi:zinc ribbon domain-containing protein [Ktedonobacter racemifer]|uniref:zinc ribbon domain-containing protein n=1 Tax=Ktedonobacter racemifer TaxID=363277 RepID=UPI003B75C5DD